MTNFERASTTKTAKSEAPVDLSSTPGGVNNGLPNQGSDVQSNDRDGRRPPTELPRSIRTRPLKLARAALRRRTFRYESLVASPTFKVDDRAAIGKRARALMSLFEPHSELLQLTYGDQITSSLRRACIAVPAAEYRSDKAETRAINIAVALMFAAYLIASFVEVFFSFPHNDVGSYFKIVIVVVLGFIVTMTLFFVIVYPFAMFGDLFSYTPTRDFRRALGSSRLPLFSVSSDSDWPAVAGISLAMASGIGAIYVALFLGHAHPFIAAELDAYGIFAMLFSSIVLAVALLINDSQVFGTHIPPDTRAFKAVCECLWAGKSLNSGIELRRYLIRRLDELAGIIRTDLPKSLDPNDRLPRSALEEFGLIANNIRSLKMWIAFPQSTTASAFSSRIALVGGALASHNYHYLKFFPEGFQSSEAVDSLPVKVSLRSRLAHFSRNLLFGFLPGAAFIFVKAIHVELSAQVETSWIISSVLWAVVSVLATQPDFKDRLSATKDISALLTQSQKKSD
jgi:hypothetical protein